MSLNLTGSLATQALNVNQQSVANGLNNFFDSGGALPPNFVLVFGLSGDGLANALTLLDGEAATGAERSAFQTMTQFSGLMLDPFVDGRATGLVDWRRTGFAPEQQAGLPPDIALAYASILTRRRHRPSISAGRRGVRPMAGRISANGDATVGSTNVTAQTFGFAAGKDYHATPITI